MIQIKIDQVLAILSTTGQVATSEASARPAPDATYDSPEQIDPQDQIAPDVLQINRRKANGCGHFAGLLLPVVFPELYGPMRTRHLFNWDGSKGKAPLDEEKKKILKTYVNFYYPETRLESSWKTCVAKMNEVLRRKYIPKGRQLQGFENVEDVNDDNHGQSLNLPDGTEDMLGNSLSDIPTPTFEVAFGTYRQYLADADYISTPL